jgi:protein TonB
LVPLSFSNRRDIWGDPGTGGGAVAVNLTAGIPLPASQAPKNPVATDTPTVNPPEPEKAKPAEKITPPKSAKEYQIEERNQKKLLAELERKRMLDELKHLPKADPNAVPGQGSKASSELYGRFPTGQGSGGIGFGGDFGSQFGWYVRAVRDCISRHWDRSRIDASVRTAPKVFLSFEIIRDGTIMNETVATSSGIPSVDREAIRAVQACSGRSNVGSDVHLPALPSAYSPGRVQVEVWFEFQQ